MAKLLSDRDDARLARLLPRLEKIIGPLEGLLRRTRKGLTPIVLPSGHITRCCLAEDHPGRGTPFRIKLGAWDPAAHGWIYDTTEEDALALDPEYEWQTYGIDWFYGVGFTYPLAGATGNFEAKPSDTYGTIWHVLGNMSCDADDCGDSGGSGSGSGS